MLSVHPFSKIFSQVPLFVKQKFERMYPYAASTQWQNSSTGYTVIYVGVKDLKYAIEYNTGGDMVNQYRELMEMETPSFISGNPAAYEGKKLWKEKTDSGEIKYYVRANNSFSEIAPRGKRNKEKPLSQN
jgi:hypothetical protein